MQLKYRTHNGKAKVNGKGAFTSFSFPPPRMRSWEKKGLQENKLNAFLHMKSYAIVLAVGKYDKKERLPIEIIVFFFLLLSPTQKRDWTNGSEENKLFAQCAHSFQPETCGVITLLFRNLHNGEKAHEHSKSRSQWANKRHSCETEQSYMSLATKHSCGSMSSHLAIISLSDNVADPN